MMSNDERDDLLADRNFILGQNYERARFLALLEEECECEQDYRCTYHRLLTIIKGEYK